MLRHLSKSKLSQRSVSLSRVQDAVQTGGDVYWDKVSFASHGDSATNDLNGIAITAVGNTAVSTAQSKFGGNSLYYDGTGDYQTIVANDRYAFGAGDFTVECWIRFSSFYNYISCIGTRMDAGATGSWSIGTQALGQFVFYSNAGEQLRGSGSGSPASGSFVANQWHHVAVTRQSGTLRGFIDGNLFQTATYTSSLGVTDFRVGAWGSGNETLTGYLDDIRITKGVARYTTNFAPPTTTFDHYAATYAPTNGDPYWTAVSFASHCDTLSADLVGHSMASIGNATVSTSQSKFGGSSWYFDGAGDAANGSIYNMPFKTGDFTVEFFMYPMGTGAYRTLVDITDPAGTTIDFRLATSNSGSGVFLVYEGSSPVITSSTTAVLNTWQHVAVTRKGTLLTLFINGIAVNTYSSTRDFQYYHLYIGANRNGTGSPYLGYVDDVRITTGVARYTANFVPPVQAFDHYQAPVTPVDGDPYYGKVELHSHFEALADQKGHTLTAVGNAAVSTSGFKFGSKALYLDGTGDYVTYSGCDWGTGDVTIEFWLRYDSGGTGNRIWELSNGENMDFSVANGTISLFSGGGTTPNGTIQANTWHHIALVRRSQVYYFFVDGVQKLTGAWTTNDSTVRTLYIGGVSNLLFQGYIDELRITKGIARYTYNFTPPNAAFYDYSPATKEDPYYDLGVKLLMHFDGVDNGTTFIDSKGHTVTAAGNACTKIAQSKFGQSSAYFDGTGDTLSSSSSDFAFGTGDFTIEFWVNPSSFSSYGCLIDTRLVNTNATGIYFRSTAAAGGQWEVRTGSGSIAITASSNLTSSSWQHIAVVRSGTAVSVYKDGVSVGNATSSQDLSDTNLIVCGAVDGYQFNGYIDDLRITKGYARYTANFTPHATPHPG